jgi:hypothetical protein
MKPLRRGDLRLWAVAPMILGGMTVGCGKAEIQVLAAGSAADAGAPAAGSRAEYCSTAGPAVIGNGDGGTICPQEFAQTTFRFAVCTCGDLVASHAVTTDSFDGALGAYDPTQARVGGALGTDGNLNASATLDVGGTLWAGGAAGLTSTAAVTAQGELHVLGLVNIEESLTVGTDAWLEGGLITTGDVLIPGTLHVPAGVPIMVGGMQTIGSTATGPVAVAPPCDCADSALLDIAAMVEGYRDRNDDLSASIDPALLENVTAPLSQSLPCGRLFFTSVGAHAPVTLTVAGRTAIFVGGDFVADQDIAVDVPQGGELDLFIEGNVLAAGQLRLGRVDNPALARVYVGGSGTVNLQNAANVSGNLYAPKAEVVLGSGAPVTVFGSIFAGGLNAGAPLTVHFDESVARDVAGCPPSGGACSTCRECGNQACSAGVCGACLDSTQCCPPSVCRSSTCVLDVR